MKNDRPNINFKPDQGLVVGPSVKEEVLRLVNEGFFDEATTLVVGITDNHSFSTYVKGSYFDGIALSGVISRRCLEGLK